MPPSSSNAALHIHLRPQYFHLLQLEPGKPLPQSVLDALATPSDGSGFLSVTRTKEEISIVSDHEIIVEGGRKQDGKLWRCFQLQGPMDLGMPIPLIQSRMIPFDHYHLLYLGPIERYHSNQLDCIGLVGVLCDLTTPLKAAGIPIFSMSTW